MPIRLACSCGKTLAAPDSLAGKQAKCPTCGKLLKVPAGQPKQAPAAAAGGGSFSDLLDEAGIKASRTGVRCPECNADMPQGAVLCVQCGYRLDLGRRLKTQTEEQTDEKDEFAGQFESHGVDALDEAEREILRRKKVDRMLTRGFPWWGWLIVLILVIGAMVGMMLSTPSTVVFILGIILIGLGCLFQTFFGIVLIVIAFRESIVQGILYLLVPFYPLFYIITRWENCKPPFMGTVAAGFVQGLGFGLMFLSPFMGG